MNGFLRTLCMMTLSGAILTLATFGVTRILRKKLPQTLQYVLWLCILLAWLLPISLFIKLPQKAVALPAQTWERIFPTEAEASGAEQTTGGQAPNTAIQIQKSVAQASVQAAHATRLTPAAAITGVYLLGAIAVFMYSVIAYLAFLHKLRAGRQTADATEHALLAAFSSKHVHLYRSARVHTPLALGLLHSSIYLPDRDYAPESLFGILRHEATHIRRGDLPIKWLCVLVCALHWCNPFVWLYRREVDRVCELACDEHVLRGLSALQRRHYGETLIHVAAETRMPHAVLSATLCEHKKNLKERLIHIMDNKKKNRFWHVLAIALIITSLLSACAIGAGKAEEEEEEAPSPGIRITDTVKQLATVEYAPPDFLAPFSAERCESLFEEMKQGIEGYADSQSIWFCVTFVQGRILREGSSWDDLLAFDSDTLLERTKMTLTATLQNGETQSEDLTIQGHENEGGWTQHWLNLDSFGGVENIKSASLRVVFGGLGEREDIIKEIPNAWELFHSQWYDTRSFLITKIANPTEEEQVQAQAFLEESLPEVLGLVGSVQMFRWHDCTDYFQYYAIYEAELLQKLHAADRIAMYAFEFMQPEQTGANRIVPGYAVLRLVNGTWEFIEMPFLTFPE